MIGYAILAFTGKATEPLPVSPSIPSIGVNQPRRLVETGFDLGTYYPRAITEFCFHICHPQSLIVVNFCRQVTFEWAPISRFIWHETK